MDSYALLHDPTVRALLHDPTVRALLLNVACAFDTDIEAAFPADMSGRLTIKARGQRFEQKIVFPRGLNWQLR